MNDYQYEFTFLPDYWQEGWPDDDKPLKESVIKYNYEEADDSVGLAEDFEWVYILNGKDVTDELNDENRKQAEKEMCKHFLQMIEDARNDFI